MPLGLHNNCPSLQGNVDIFWDVDSLMAENGLHSRSRCGKKSSFFCFKFCFFDCEARGIFAPPPGMEAVPLAPEEGQVLITGPPGRPPSSYSSRTFHPYRWGSGIPGMKSQGQPEITGGSFSRRRWSGSAFGTKMSGLLPCWLASGLLGGKKFKTTQALMIGGIPTRASSSPVSVSHVKPGLQDPGD